MWSMGGTNRTQDDWILNDRAGDQLDLQEAREYDILVEDEPFVPLAPLHHIITNDRSNIIIFVSLFFTLLSFSTVAGLAIRSSSIGLGFLAFSTLGTLPFLSLIAETFRFKRAKRVNAEIAARVLSRYPHLNVMIEEIQKTSNPHERRNLIEVLDEELRRLQNEARDIARSKMQTDRARTVAKMNDARRLNEERATLTDSSHETLAAPATIPVARHPFAIDQHLYSEHDNVQDEVRR